MRNHAELHPPINPTAAASEATANIARAIAHARRFGRRRADQARSSIAPNTPLTAAAPRGKTHTPVFYDAAGTLCHDEGEMAEEKAPQQEPADGPGGERVGSSAGRGATSQGAPGAAPGTAGGQDPSDAAPRTPGETADTNERADEQANLRDPS